MLDIATVWDPVNFVGDWQFANGDIVMDAGLVTPTLISLLTDRTANADDVIPDRSADRRGCWADLPLPGAPVNPDGSNPDPCGSGLWLRTRSKATPAVAVLCQNDCSDALAWMITAGIAQEVDVATQWLTGEQLGIVVDIDRQSVLGTAPDHTYDLAWSATLAA